MHPASEPDDLDDPFTEEEEARLRAILGELHQKELGALEPAPAAEEPMAPRKPSTTPPPPQAAQPKVERETAPAAGTGRYLKVLAGPDKGVQFPLPAHGVLRVGRAPEVEVHLSDPRVSRNHCRVRVDSGRVSVRDLGSKTGTLLNNEPIDGERELLTGDLLMVGGTPVQLVSDEMTDTSDHMPALKVAARPSSDHPAVTVQDFKGRSGSPAHDLVRLSNTTLGYLALGPLLGVGRSGAVFRALDTRDQGPVAVKVFIPEFSFSEEDVQRFVRAAKTIMPLRNLHLIDFYNAGRLGGHCWVSMELIEGPSLAWHVQQAASAPTQWKLALRVLRDVTRALIFLHGKQIVHRNLTPENLLVNSVDGLIKVGDLITAKAQDGKLAHDVTAHGHLIGDLRFLAPERTSGDPSAGDARSDLYSLGAVVYAVLTGRPPLEGKNPLDALDKIRNRVPTPLRQVLPATPPALDAVVSRLLEKEPGRRFENATELLRHLVAHKLMD